MAEEKDKQGLSAEALEAMAAGQQADPSETLQSQDSAELLEAHDALEGLAADEGYREELAESYDPAVLEGLPGEADAALARRAQVADTQVRARRVHAEQFKRTMIPMMLVLGVVMFIVAIATLIKLSTRRQVDSYFPAEGTDLLVTYGKWMAAAAFLLGSVLLLGAWLFHRETSAEKPR